MNDIYDEQLEHAASKATDTTIWGSWPPGHGYVTLMNTIDELGVALPSQHTIRQHNLGLEFEQHCSRLLYNVGPLTD